MNKAIRVYDIQWEWNYENHSHLMTREEYEKDFDLEPTEMIVDVSDWDLDETDVDEIEQSLSDYISDESGYYHEGYSWEWMEEEIVGLETQIEFSNIQYETYGDNSVLNELPHTITYTLEELQWKSGMDLDNCIVGIDNASNMLVDKYGYKVIGYNWKISK